MKIEFIQKVNEFVQLKKPFVTATLIETVGSAPQDQGSKIIVDKNGILFGTIGGGKIEARVIQESKNLLEKFSETKQEFYFVDWGLKTDIGMTCGGRVKIFFELYNLKQWEIVVFGAGHVSNALINILVNLNCSIQCFDGRQEWLDKLPNKINLEKKCLSNPSDEVECLSNDSFVIIMTEGHSTDLPILGQCLKLKKFPYLGVIGSRSKKRVLINELKTLGLDFELENKFLCPVGLPIGKNDPNEIAISVVSQLLEIRDQVQNV